MVPMQSQLQSFLFVNQAILIFYPYFNIMGYFMTLINDKIPIKSIFRPGCKSIYATVYKWPNKSAN